MNPEDNHENLGRGRLNLASLSSSLQIIKLESKTNQDPGTSWSYYKEQGLKLIII